MNQTLVGAVINCENVLQQLYNEFVAHIAELKNLDSRIQRKVEKLESALQREARAHADKINDLQKSNQVAFTHFQVKKE